MARDLASAGCRAGQPFRAAAAPWLRSCAGLVALLLIPAAAGATETAAPAAGSSPIAAAVLPSSRSVQIGNWATVFATMINGGSSALGGCAVSPTTSVPANFAYQTTDGTTNALTGSPNTPASIGAGASQSFVLSFQPMDAFNPTQIALSFACSGVSAATSMPGLNTVLLSGSASPVPDVVALAATAGNTGTLSISGTPDAGAFAVATVNLGSGDMITASVNTGSVAQPLGLGVCQTNPSTGACMGALASTVTVSVPANSTPTFGVFGTATAAIPFDPANNRVFVQFTDSTGTVRGATSVAVVAAAPYVPPPNPYR